MKNPKDDIYNAENPIRKFSINLIEKLQDEWGLPDWKDEDWFSLEDMVTEEINGLINLLKRK